MMNGVSSVGVNNQNYQMSFKAKGANKQNALKPVDILGIKVPREIELSRRPIEEQKETAIRRSLKFLKDLKIKDLFVGKKVKPNETTVEHINAAVETANNASRAVYLEQLRKTDPELYKEVLRREAEHKVASMGTMELLKNLQK